MEDSRLRQNLSFNKQAVLKGSWAICLLFTAVFIIVSIITADDNEKSDGGYRVVGFSGIWTAFMMTAIMSLSAQVVFDNCRSPFVIGALIGSSFMLAQLQFVMMIVYFVFADHAKNNDHDVNDSDRALGAFSLFTMLSYILLGGVLLWFKNDLSGEADQSEEEERMISQKSESPSETSSNDKRTTNDNQYSIESNEESDVVDIDLEETETF